MKSISKLTVAIVFCVVLLFPNQALARSVRHLQRDDVTGHVSSSAEEILATREQRRIEFTERLERYKEELELHETGHRRLHPVEVDKLTRKIRAYENKLEHLNKELSDRHINRLLEREAMLNEMHRSRIDSRSEL